MAIQYDVSEETIAKWMGRVKYILNPKLLYKEERVIGRRKVNLEVKILEEEYAIKDRKYVKGGNKIKKDRTEYYRNYHLTKVKTNPEKLEKRRKMSREWVRKFRK